jgi:hypothetical protein
MPQTSRYTRSKKTAIKQSPSQIENKTNVPQVTTLSKRNRKTQSTKKPLPKKEVTIFVQQKKPMLPVLLSREFIPLKAAEFLDSPDIISFAVVVLKLLPTARVIPRNTELRASLVLPEITTLATLPGVEWLNLRFVDKIRYYDEELITQLTSLKRLTLKSYQGELEGQWVNQLRQLESLHLEGAIFNSRVCLPPSLTELSIRCAGLNNYLLPKLKYFINLRKLTLITSSEVGQSSHVKEKNKSELTDTLAELYQLTHFSTDISYFGDILQIMCLSKLSQLQELSITHSEELCDFGLEKLAQCTNLVKLDLSCCTIITDTGIAELKTLTQLTELKLENVFSCGEYLTDVSLLTIGTLTNLTVLNMRNSRITTLQPLVKVTQLRHLNISKCVELWGDVGATLSSFPQLTSLLAIESNLTTDVIQHLVPLKKLTHLEIGRAFNDSRGNCDFISHLSQMTTLTVLKMISCYFTNSEVEALTTLTALKTLNLSSLILSLQQTFFDEESLSHLTKLPCLTDLDVSGNLNITTKGLTKFLPQFPRLVNLNLSSCCGLDVSIFPLIQKITSLKIVHLNELGYFDTHDSLYITCLVHRPDLVIIGVNDPEEEE